VNSNRKLKRRGDKELLMRYDDVGRESRHERMLRRKPKLPKRRRRPRGRQARSNWSEPESRRSGLRMVLSLKPRSRICAFIQFSGLRRSISRRSSALLVGRSEGWLDTDAHIVLCSSAKSASTTCDSHEAPRSRSR